MRCFYLILIYGGQCQRLWSLGKKTQYQNNGWFNIKLREQGINSITQLDDLIKKSADDRQVLLDKIKKIETEMKSLSQDMENINTVNKYREIYKYHKKNPGDKQFADEYYSELSLYKIAAKEILENYKKLPNKKRNTIKPR